MIGDVAPPELRAALETDDKSLQRERERLWYVAYTRARGLLIVPELAQAEQTSWARVVDLIHDALPELDVSRMTPAPTATIADPPNRQTSALFSAEHTIIEDAGVPLTCVRPSDHDSERLESVKAITLDAGDAPEADLPIGAGRIRCLPFTSCGRGVDRRTRDEIGRLLTARAN